jgi:SsrA-binding protein
MKVIAYNRKAKFNYEIEEEIEAGIVLLGSEIKSIREGKITINESYASEINGDIILINTNIAEYKGANRFNHEPKRPRKLLLHKKQINKIIGKINFKGYSLIPLKIYFNDKNMIKVLLGIAKGKKLYDKRKTIKERDQKRAEARGEE